MSDPYSKKARGLILLILLILWLNEGQGVQRCIRGESLGRPQAFQARFPLGFFLNILVERGPENGTAVDSRVGVLMR